MAQQELLLLILAIVIVAIAVAGGISSFTDGAKQSRQDAIVARSIELSTASQEWMSTSSTYGGGNGSFDRIDIWKVTDQTGTGIWLDEDDAHYMVAQDDVHLDRARLVAEVEGIDTRVEIEFNGTAIISTTIIDPGVIYF